MQACKVLLVSVLSVVLVGCANMTNEGGGALSGAVVGGLLGSAVGRGPGNAAAIVGGAFLGSVVGGHIGRNMDRQDRMEMYYGLRSNHRHRWHNSRNGNRYEFVPMKTYYQEDQENGRETCREYRTTAFIGDKRQTIYGTACRSPNGDWEVVDAAR